MPSPPPPPSPPPAPWVEDRDGWGVPSDCLCSGYNSSLGFGAYCKGWEFEGQTPWCYVASSCPAAASTGSFGHAFFSCSKKPSGLSALMGRRLRALADKGAAKAEKKVAKEQGKAAKKAKVEAKVAKKITAEKEPTPLSKIVEATTGKKVSSKAGGKVRCRGDTGEIQGRHRGDTGEIQGRYRSAPRRAARCSPGPRHALRTAYCPPLTDGLRLTAYFALLTAGGGLLATSTILAHRP